MHIAARNVKWASHLVITRGRPASRFAGALAGVMLLVGWQPGVQVAVTCNGQVQIAPSDSLGLVEVAACADSVVYCVAMTLTSGVPDEPEPVDGLAWLRAWRAVLGWTWL